MKLNLEDDNVFQLDLTVAECRDFDPTVAEKIEEALDETQALIFGTDEGNVAFLVIKVTR
jgi:ActR/RegA family two-component response regulator